jgi:hypothetical protein
MAGGMIPGRAGRSLSERAASSGVIPPPSPVASSQAAPSQAAPSQAAPLQPSSPQPASPLASDSGEGRHCWVHDPPDSPGIWPGLLVEWRQRTEGWQGRVAYTVTGPHGPALVETWIPAARLEPR